MLTLRSRLLMKRKFLSWFLPTTRATPGKGRNLDWGSDPGRKGEMVGRLLNLGEGNTSGNTATLGQRRSRGPIRQSDR